MTNAFKSRGLTNKEEGMRYAQLMKLFYTLSLVKLSLSLLTKVSDVDA